MGWGACLACGRNISALRGLSCATHRTYGRRVLDLGAVMAVAMVVLVLAGVGLLTVMVAWLTQD